MTNRQDKTKDGGVGKTIITHRSRLSRWFGRQSFRSKLLLLISLVSSIALGIFGFSVLVSDCFDMRSDAMQNVSVLADVVGANSTAPLSFGDREAARDLLQSLQAEPLFQFARLTTEEGEVLATSGEEPPGLLDSDSNQFLPIPHFKGQHLIHRQGIFLDGERLGSFMLVYDLSREYADLIHEGVGLLGMIFTAWIIAFLFSSLAQRTLTRPVHHLSEIARQISTEQAYSLRAEKFNDDELGELTDSFNAMLDLIQLRDTALAQSQVDLEQRVLERTDDLDRTNRELSEEIEERAMVEVELRKATALAEESTRTKSDFLANMSHELRTPMTAILGYSDLLLDSEQSESQLADSVQTIRRNGEHLLGLINDILDISKIEAGKMTVERIECSPAEIIVDVVSLMRVRAEGKGLTLGVEYAFPMPSHIQSDPVRFKQILINLVGNAIKFTETGGVHIIFRCDKPEKGAAQLRIEVVDTGIGMTPKQIENIFQPFTQADSTMTRQFGGTGLGLTISKRLAEILGGDITIRSIPGEGSSFIFSLNLNNLEGVPLLEEMREAKFISPSRSSAADKIALISGSVLLAEDGPDNQRLISYLLRKAGASVEIAENGQIAFDMAIARWEEQNPFDIILMDMQMPEMNGYEASTALRKKGYSGPIIALTAHAMAGDREKCLAAGCDDYTTKPIKKEVLLGIIQSYLSDTMTKGEAREAF